jgi:hypothetical protein
MGRVTASAILVGLALAAAAGCGSGGNSDEDEITGVLTTSFTTADPVQCEEVTQKAMEQLAPTAAAAKDPVAACRSQLDPSSNAHSIRVTNVAVDGSHATATVVPDGGSFQGATVRMALVDDDGWKIDGIADVQLTNRDQFLRTIDKSAKQSFGNDAFTPEESGCIARYIRDQVSTSEIERAIVSGDSRYQYDAVRFCLGGGTDFIALIQIVDNQLVHAGIDPAVAQCSSGASLAGIKNATLEEFAASREVQERVVRAVKEAAQFCVTAGK